MSDGSDRFGVMNDWTENARLMEADRNARDFAGRINPALIRNLGVNGPAGFFDIAEPTLNTSLKATTGVHAPGFIDMAAPTVRSSNPVVKADGPFIHHANGFVAYGFDVPTLP